VTQLESFLQTPLLTRSGWQLTPAGQRCFQQARQLLQNLTQLEQHLLPQAPPLWQGHLRLGCLAYLDLELRDTCLRLMQQHPGLSVELRVYDHLETIERELRQHQLDLAIQPHVSVSTQLESQLYLTSPLVAVAAANAAGQAEAALPYLTCLAPEPLSWYLSWPHQLMGEPLPIAVEIPTALELACAGVGALWLPLNAVAQHLQNGSLKLLQTPAYQRSVPFFMVWASPRESHPCLNQLIRELRPHVIPV